MALYWNPKRARLTLSFAVLLGTMATASDAQLQKKRSERDVAVAAELSNGPHLGSPEDAVVGIEVTSSSADGAAAQTKRGSGLVLRCDGFVVAPSSLFGKSLSVAGRAEDAAQQLITVVIHPGTPLEKRVQARPPRYIPRNLGYAVIKMEGVHVPALRTMLPDPLKAGDTVQVIGVGWDATRSGFRTTRRFDAVLSKAAEGDGSESAPGEIGLSVNAGNPVAGSVVIGPSGTAVGLVTTLNSVGQCDRFVAFSVLDRASNCVTPLPAPPDAASNTDGMVDVAGGPFLLPFAFEKEQPDMAGLGVACVAPFKIDEREVSNREYLKFWLTLPDSDRKRLGFQSNYFPASWSKTDPPFPGSIAELPVIGVPMPGALAYAKAQGKRLPTPYEWALAALGPKGENGIDWAKRYVDERNQAWGRIKEEHMRYLQLNPQLQQEIYYAPSHYALPWMAASPAAAAAARWSKQTSESILEPLWQTWRDPIYLLPGGSREFDVSPCGAKDMLLNASEMVQPYPGAPNNGRVRFMGIAFERREPNQKDPWAPRTLSAINIIDYLPPLSRLTRRAFLSPPPDELISMSNMSELLTMMAPLAGWSVSFSPESTVTISGLIPRRPTGSVIVKMPGMDMYEGKPKHYRDEIGIPIPMDHTDRSPSSGPQLYYMAPAGFRCVR